MSPRSGLLGVLVPDETTRRAFEETFADWRDEWTRAATPNRTPSREHPRMDLGGEARGSGNLRWRGSLDDLGGLLDDSVRDSRAVTAVGFMGSSVQPVAAVRRTLRRRCCPVGATGTRIPHGARRRNRSRHQTRPRAQRHHRRTDAVRNDGAACGLGVPGVESDVSRVCVFQPERRNRRPHEGRAGAQCAGAHPTGQDWIGRRTTSGNFRAQQPASARRFRSCVLHFRRRSQTAAVRAKAMGKRAVRSRRVRNRRVLDLQLRPLEDPKHVAGARGAAFRFSRLEYLALVDCVVPGDRRTSREARTRPANPEPRNPEPRNLSGHQSEQHLLRNRVNLRRRRRVVIRDDREHNPLS